MPRAARVVFPSMPYHIVSRGNNRERVFEEKEDFEKYLEICRRHKDQYEFVLRTPFLENSLLYSTTWNSIKNAQFQSININEFIDFELSFSYVQRIPRRVLIIQDQTERSTL